MSKIKIMCTSTGCIEYAPERYRNLGIDILRVHLFFNGKEYLEGYDLDPDEFYSQLETLEDPKNNLPKTSVPSLAEIAEHFDKAIEEGYDEIIAFCISSGLGGTYNAVSLVARDYADKIKIHVVDTQITCFNEGYLAVNAAKMVADGKSSEDILKETAWMIKRQELIGKMLGICPVVHFNEIGECVSLETTRSPKKALARTCEIIKEKIGDRSPEDYMLFRLYTGKKYLEVLKGMEETYGIKTNHEDMIMSPVSGCHNGPWLAGYELIFLRRDDEPLED